MILPYIMEIENVWNHQPVIIYLNNNKSAKIKSIEVTLKSEQLQLCRSTGSHRPMAQRLRLDVGGSAAEFDP